MHFEKEVIDAFMESNGPLLQQAIEDLCACWVQSEGDGDVAYSVSLQERGSRSFSAGGTCLLAGKEWWLNYRASMKDAEDDLAFPPQDDTALHAPPLEAERAPASEAPASEAPASEPAEPSQEPEQEPAPPEVTLPILKASAAELVAKGGVEQLKSILSQLDAPNLSGLPEDKWAGAYYAVRAALAVCV